MDKIKTFVDVRDYPPHDKHPAIMRHFEDLKPGEKMELINDHDPRPLYHQFQAELPDQFRWEYLQKGPDVWRVAIMRTEN